MSEQQQHTSLRKPLSPEERQQIKTLMFFLAFIVGTIIVVSLVVGFLSLIIYR